MYTLTELQNIVARSLASINFKLEPEELYAPLEYMVSIGGKRLRPLTCLLTYSLFSDKMEKSVLDPAMALEIFHSFTLIHDDIMDNASIRRGQPTVYKKWNSNIAILSGDVMSIKSYELLSSAPQEHLPQVLSLFTRTAAQVCEGQQYDMNFEHMPFITMEDYLSMIGLKTAVLIACSAKMGAVIAGADRKTCDALYDFAYTLGIAFQIQDDYLDTFGQSSIFGKSIGGDIVNNKKSWLLVETFKRSNGASRDELNYLLSLESDRAQEKIDGMQQLYIKLGVKEAAERCVEEYRGKALEILNTIGLTDEQKALLTEYSNNLIKRNK